MFDAGFTDLIVNLFPIFFLAMFAVVFVMLIATAAKGHREKKANDTAPILEQTATVTRRRTHMSGMIGGGLRTRAARYVTFVLDNGDRMEFQVRDTAYERLAEGDRGVLRFQGSRFLDFQGEEIEGKQE